MRKRLLPLFVLALLAGQVCLATTYRYIGGNGNWYTASNWENGVMPLPMYSPLPSGDSILVQGTGAITYNTAPNAVFNAFKQSAGVILVLEGGQLTIASEFTNFGKLLVKGTLITQGYIAGMGVGTIEVSGTLQKQGAIFDMFFIANPGSSIINGNPSVVAPLVVGSGSYTIAGGASLINAEGSTLSGSGTISGTGAVLNDGILSPGASPGRISLGGS